MSTAYGCPQGEGSGSSGHGEGSKTWFSCGHHTWMTPM